MRRVLCVGMNSSKKHENWKEAQAPVLLKELRELVPQQSESMIAHCLRVEQLSSKLANVACLQCTHSVVHDMLNGMERPAGVAGHERCHAPLPDAGLGAPGADCL
jgi:hypothetical protein